MPTVQPIHVQEHSATKSAAYIEVCKNDQWQFCGVINLPRQVNAFSLLARINNAPQLAPVAAGRRLAGNVSLEIENRLTKHSFTTWYTLDELLSFDWENDQSEPYVAFLHELKTLRPLAADPRHIRINVILS